MADTQRTEAELLALYPDNSVGGISAQDGRDFIVSSKLKILPYSSTMTGNEAFIASSVVERIYFLDPNGAHRNFDPSGVFSTGFVATVINVGGSYNIVFDSGASAQTLTPGSIGTFIYDGSKWW